MKRRLLVAAGLLALLGVQGASAATTRLDSQGTVLLNGRKVFPIVLAKGPPPGSTTPRGADGLGEVIGAGVNFFRVGPAATTWTDADTLDALAWNREVATRGAYTWINLSRFATARPGSRRASLLRSLVHTLEHDPSGRAIGMWKGVEEPWRQRIAPSKLRFGYCLATGRGERRWCAGEAPVDRDHLWVTIQAPRGLPSDLSRYSGVTDLHGVNNYPVALGNPDPWLDLVGIWTDALAASTPNRAVWTTLQICWRWSYDANGNFALPTRRQERYMVYDAIINGARSLAFYGGNNPRCWNETDAAHRWSWTYWNEVLGPLVREIGAASPIAPVLVNPASTRGLPSSDPTTRVMSRRGHTRGDLWVIATRSGEGTQAVTIGGLPASVTSGTVYTEGRSVAVENGSFTDTFERWEVHVYRFHVPAVARPRSGR